MMVISIAGEDEVSDTGQRGPQRSPRWRKCNNQSKTSLALVDDPPVHHQTFCLVTIMLQNDHSWTLASGSASYGLACNDL